MSRPATTEGLRCLVACTACRRQYDAAGYAAKSRFHCSCGAVIEVPRFRANDAAVVRCSSCSAPRSKSSETCSHCGADYTLHEQDLHTLCSKCMARVSDRARFCHHCATPVLARGRVGQPTRRPCPACGRRNKLVSRQVRDAELTLLECPGCAGIWLDTEAFELLTERAREAKLPERLTGGRRSPAGDAKTTATAALYRRCPHCETHMHRRNFGRGSGVVIDSCRDHGLWFDARELDVILRWVREGGEERVARKAASEERHADRLRRISVELPRESEPVRAPKGFSLEGLEWTAIDVLFDLFGSSDQG